MKNKNINIIISSIVSIIISTIFIPIKASGGIANKSFYGRTNILTILFNIDNSICIDCYNYKILWHFLLMEIILLFIISLIILNFIDKRRKNNE